MMTFPVATTFRSGVPAADIPAADIPAADIPAAGVKIESGRLGRLWGGRRFALMVLAGILLAATGSAATGLADDGSAGDGSAGDGVAADEAIEVSGRWKVCQFGGDGPVEIKPPEKSAESGDNKLPVDNKSPVDPGPLDRVITLSIGDPMTGVYFDGKFPKTNYTIKYKAKRVEGFDFFAALTFPVGSSTVTFVPGGWGGGVTGISSIDGYDASSNETTRFVDFRSGRWYEFSVTVTDGRIVCAVDGRTVASVSREGKTFSMRDEMDVCKPLGIAAFQSDAIIRDIRVSRP